MQSLIGAKTCLSSRPRVIRRARDSSAWPSLQRQPKGPLSRCLAWLERHKDGASRLGGYAALVFLLATAGYGTVLGGHLRRLSDQIVEQANAMIVTGGFGIQEVIVKGQRHVSDQQIRTALSTAEAPSIFSYDTEAAQRRLEKIGWVRHAQVLRLWPSSLVVKIAERTAFARWRVRDRVWLIDADGEILAADSPEFASLPLVSGEGANRAAQQLFDLLVSRAELFARLRYAQRIEARRWNLVFEDGMTAKLPATGLEAALDQLKRVLNTNRFSIAKVHAIDLRIAGKIILRLDDAAENPAGKLARSVGPDTSQSRRPL